MNPRNSNSISLDKIKSIIDSGNVIAVKTDYHFGGYAKINLQLIQFIKRFEIINNIPLEPIYTGKLFYGIYELIRTGYFKRGKTILAIHTGGLQGLAGMKSKMEKLLTNNSGK